MLKLNLGCGANRLDGWENHDADLDITKPLPVADGSVDFILIEHCIEHVPLASALSFFKEAWRVLKPFGVMRVIVPDITRISREADEEYCVFVHQKGWAPSATVSGAIEAIVTQHGHQTAWDQGVLRAMLMAAGFVDVDRCRTRVSRHPELHNIDGHWKAIGEKFNAIESLVMEATKI